MNNSKEELEQLFSKQKKFFSTYVTKDIDFRLEKLSLLYTSIVKHEQAIYDALKKDLRKSKIEAYEGEIYPPLAEISYAKKHLRSWAKPQRASGPKFFPLSRGYVYEVPFGVSIIFSPYNHPFSTSFVPLVNAIAAGNCVILKPSELVLNSMGVIKDIIKNVFPEEYVSVVFGGKEVSQALLELEVDNIFFTGSTNIGRSVMEAAAKKLIPVTLELSSKCPGIVDKSADIKNAAARIVWGKFWNAGQACNTIDYLFVHSEIKNEFVAYLKEYIVKYYTADPQKSDNYGRLLNERHFDRISHYLGEGNIIVGGKLDKNDLYISPTLMDNIRENATLLEEEIFGPVLPIFVYEDIHEVISKINAKPKTLAIYVFSRNSHLSNEVIDKTESGTVCINDLMIQAMSPAMPLGGVGGSGFGRMHGKAGFEAFSYKRSVLKQVTFDFPLRFPPYRENFLLPLLKKFLR